MKGNVEQLLADVRAPRNTRVLRWLVPMLLVLLFLLVLIWLPWQARQMESNERQQQLVADTLWVERTLRFELARAEDALTALGSDLAAASAPDERLRARMAHTLKGVPAMYRLAWLDAAGNNRAVQGGTLMRGARVQAGAPAAAMARTTGHARYSEPYGAASSRGGLIDFYLPLYDDGTYAGMLVATYELQDLLDDTVPWWFAQDNELMLEARGAQAVAHRASGGPGRGVYTHRHALGLPGAELVLSTNSTKTAPQLLPNLLVGSVVVLALGLMLSLAALWRHISRTLAAESALRQQMAFRTAMENSLLTGLRARDLQGRVTYVNRAFCKIVGLPPEQLIGQSPPMAYWSPETRAEHEKRFRSVLAGTFTPQYETVFQRPDGTRVPVLVFEAVKLA